MRITMLCVGGDYDREYVSLDCNAAMEPPLKFNLIDKVSKSTDRHTFTTYETIEQSHKYGGRFFLLCTAEIAAKFRSGEVSWTTYGDKAKIS